MIFSNVEVVDVGGGGGGGDGGAVADAVVVFSLSLSSLTRRRFTLGNLLKKPWLRE